MIATAEAKRHWIQKFFRPRLTGWFWLRLAIVAAAAYVIFGYFLLPCVVNGSSMEPTYASFGLNFCIRERDAGNRVKTGDVVIIRYAPRIFYLKRVIGEPGDTVEFVRGKLIRNGVEVPEPYVTLPSDWDSLPFTVPEGTLFAVGDNRSMPMQQHKFGVVEKERIIGEPLW